MQMKKIKYAYKKTQLSLGDTNKKYIKTKKKKYKYIKYRLKIGIGHSDI